MTGEQTFFTVGQVFVPGGLPTITYNPRSDLNLEQRVQDYLAEKHRILSVSGPTKTGKTVLLRNILDNPIWLSGGDISSAESFWMRIADALSVFTESEVSRQQSDSESTSHSVGGGVVGVLKGDHGRQQQISYSTGDRSSRTRPVAAAAKSALIGALRPLVVDDFHYIPAPIQLEIVRGLKDAVFDGLPVIFAAVPHRAYDAVRVEKEMTGRVEQLPVGFWSSQDLHEIAVKGFAALNVADSDNHAERLASESFSSPHLMQDFCLQLCKQNDVRNTQAVSKQLEAPDWENFFASRASAASKTSFDLLARGPRQRSDRKERTLKDGTITDIYGAVLRAVAKTGPLTALTYEELRSALREVLSSEAPQRHEVTRVLEEMSKIAREQIDGEPVVDYDEQLATLLLRIRSLRIFFAGVSPPSKFRVMGPEISTSHDPTGLTTSDICIPLGLVPSVATGTHA